MPSGFLYIGPQGARMTMQFASETVECLGGIFGPFSDRIQEETSSLT
jgi:hypothetical protein